MVAVVSILCGGVIGTTVGVAAGYFGRWVDIIVMRTVDISLSIPIILLALVLVAALGASFWKVVIELVLLLWAHARACPVGKRYRFACRILWRAPAWPAPRILGLC
jgi:ABC-type dipeptide/oligopeptide/nickel transport system permease subunit